jgi:L-lactate utilization protein LutB
MPFAFEHHKARDQMTDYELESLLDRLVSQREARREKRRQQDPERDAIREDRRERRQRIVDRLAALIGIAGGHFTGANWAGKALALAILSVAAAALKWIFTQ